MPSCSPKLTSSAVFDKRFTGRERVLHVARPMLIKDAKCLACHDTRDTALVRPLFSESPTRAHECSLPTQQ